MPNGGSDCCGTCWFNSKNKGEAGYEHAHDREADFCMIRQISIIGPFYTYCANHPHKNAKKVDIPIGPVFIGDSSGKREVWVESPDTDEIREKLLANFLRSALSLILSEYLISIRILEKKIG